jgi:hypothetical protein
MEARAHKFPTSRDWKEVYKAALFEDDNAKIPQRIAEAERALAARALELFRAGGDQIHEQQAMENARYFLRVLGSTAGTLDTAPEYVGQTKSLSSKRTSAAQAFFISEGRQDLHTALSTPPFCNE